MPQHSLVGVPSLECLATGSTANFRTSHCRFYIGQQTFTGGAGEANEIDPFGLSGVVKVLLAAIFHESSVSVCMPCGGGLKNRFSGILPIGGAASKQRSKLSRKH